MVKSWVAANLAPQTTITSEPTPQAKRSRGLLAGLGNMRGIREGYSDIGVVALAALNSPRDLATARRFVRAAKIAPRVFVVHDSVAALHAATHGKPGIVVISGTGCVAAGINKAGRYVRAGGWGYLIDDEGSAYDIGTKALRSAFRTLDGRTPRTKLASALKRRFRVKMLENASPLIYSDEFGIDSIAGLTPLVSKLAPSDEVCREILRNAGVALAEIGMRRREAAENRT